MDIQNTNKIFKVVLSVGDESGIGPEIILKALCSNQLPKNIEFILVGSKKKKSTKYI
jgi:4-hydroxythreonine-4-phosphate dehydrogenase